MVVKVCNSKIQRVEAGRPGAQGHPQPPKTAASLGYMRPRLKKLNGVRQAVRAPREVEGPASGGRNSQERSEWGSAPEGVPTAGGNSNS